MGGATLGVALPRLINYSESKPNVPSYIFNTVERQGYFMGTHDCGFGSAEHVLALDPEEKNYVLIERAFQADKMKTYVSTMANIADDLRWFEINQPERCVEYREYDIEDNLMKDFVDTLVVPIGLLSTLALVYRTGQSMRDHHRQGAAVKESLESLGVDIQRLLQRSKKSVLQYIQRNGFNGDPKALEALKQRVLASDSLQKGDGQHPTIRALMGLERSALARIFNTSIKEATFNNRHTLKMFLIDRVRDLRADVISSSILSLVKRASVRKVSIKRAPVERVQVKSIEGDDVVKPLSRDNRFKRIDSSPLTINATSCDSLNMSDISVRSEKSNPEVQKPEVQKKKIKTRPDSKSPDELERSAAEHSVGVASPPASFQLSEDGRSYTITLPKVKELSRADGVIIRFRTIRMPADSNTRDVAFQAHCLKLFDRMVTILPSKSRGTPGLKRCQVQGRSDINYKLKFTQNLYARLRYVGRFESDAETLNLFDTLHY